MQASSQAGAHAAVVLHAVQSPKMAHKTSRTLSDSRPWQHRPSSNLTGA